MELEIRSFCIKGMSHWRIERRRYQETLFKKHRQLHNRKQMWGRKMRKRGRRAGRKLQKKKIQLGEGIFNFSGVPLKDEDEQIKVFDKGLKFAPFKT